MWENSWGNLPQHSLQPERAHRKAWGEAWGRNFLPKCKPVGGLSMKPECRSPHRQNGVLQSEHSRSHGWAAEKKKAKKEERGVWNRAQSKLLWRTKGRKGRNDRTKRERKPDVENKRGVCQRNAKKKPTLRKRREQVKKRRAKESATCGRARGSPTHRAD